MTCIKCSKPLTGLQTRFCSSICKSRSQQNNNYAAQCKRAIDRKIKLIKLLGGKCAKCGYLKNMTALDFHHKNPKQKDSKMDSRKLANSTWDWCLTEAAKCQLLCANCHREEHNPQYNGLIQSI